MKMQPAFNSTQFTIQGSTGCKRTSDYVGSNQPLTFNIKSIQTTTYTNEDLCSNRSGGSFLGNYRASESMMDNYEYQKGLPQRLDPSFNVSTNSDVCNANLSLYIVNCGVKTPITTSDIQAENRKRNTHSEEADGIQKKRRVYADSDEQNSCEIRSSAVTLTSIDENGRKNCKVEFSSEKAGISDQLKTVQKAESNTNSGSFNETGADHTRLISDLDYSKRTVNIQVQKRSKAIQDPAIRVPFDQKSVGGFKKSPTFSITNKGNRVSAPFSIEKITALAKHKFDSVKDHYLLNKPMSLHDATKVFCSNKIDAELKKGLASRIQQKQVIGVGSTKLTETCNSQTTNFIEPIKDKRSYKCSIFSETKQAGSTKDPNQTISIKKHDETNRNSIFQIVPAYEQATDFSHINQQDGKFQANVGNLIGNTKKKENPKKLFYVISNGSQTRTISQETEHVLVDKPEKSKTSEELLKGGKSFNSKISEQGTYVMNGLVVASPKPITQEIYKKLQADTNILKSLKAPTCTETSVKVLNPLMKTSSRTSEMKQANENNNRAQPPDMQMYHSKLTVAQLLKNKRGEEQLEMMLKSKLNTSSNASSNASEKSKQCNSKDDSATEQTNSNNGSKNHEAPTVSPDHSYIRLQGNCSNSGTIKQDSNELFEKKTDTKANNSGKAEKAYKIQNTIQASGGKTNSNCHDMAFENRSGTFSVKVGRKMVIMRKPSTPTSPELLKRDRKKLPAPKPRKHKEPVVKKDTITLLKNKIKKSSMSPKDVLVEKLKLMPKSKLVKKLNDVKQRKNYHYSIDTKNTSEKEIVNTSSLPMNVEESALHRENEEKCFVDTFAPVLQLWKDGDGTFTHNIQMVKFDGVSSANGRFNRWYEYSDYPCIIHLTQDRKILRIETGNIGKGFYLLTRTDNVSTSEEECNNQPMPASLSSYPPNLSLLPNSSRALVIGTMLEEEKYHENLLSQLDKCEPGLDDLIRLLLPTIQDLSSAKDERYSSVVEKTMSPRICSPTFYSNNMQAYFSDMNKPDTVKSYNNKTVNGSAAEKPSSKSKFLTKLPSCSSKAAALKKKQNELLKTCQKLKKVKRLKSTEKSTLPVFNTKPAAENTSASYHSVANITNLNEGHESILTDTVDRNEDIIVDVVHSLNDLSDV